jgi:hypothetical protein
MATTERVTVSLPVAVVRDIDRLERNRSKFVLEAVRRELDRRRGAELRRSLDNPHPDSARLAEEGFDDWAKGLPAEDASDLVDIGAGKPVRWSLGEGWLEPRE